MELDRYAPNIHWQGRAILLVDLDAFFASVEQLDHPGWRNKPVIVGGDSDKRGVVATCSYEARAYGVRSAMPSSQARQLCPDAIWTRGHYQRYREVSDRVMAILRDETPFVEQVSIDEAFMDVTPTKVNPEDPVAIAQRIQSCVAELGVTCSIGVGTSKSIAKIASDMDKPRGLTVVYPGSEEAFIRPLPVRSLSGIGKSSEATLHAHGIETLGDLIDAGQEKAERLLGKSGRISYLRAMGLDDDTIHTEREVKSVSHEISFATDITQIDELHAAIGSMAGKVGRRLRRKQLTGRTLTLKLRYSDRSVHSVQRQLTSPCDDELIMTPLLYDMLSQMWRPGIAIRLVGVAVSGFGEDPRVQESLFELDEETRPALDDGRRRGLLEASDAVKEKFGEHAVQFGRDIRSEHLTTGTTSKNPQDHK